MEHVKVSMTLQPQRSQRVIIKVEPLEPDSKYLLSSPSEGEYYLFSQLLKIKIEHTGGSL